MGLPRPHDVRGAEIVARDLCIGCGLCEALTGGRVKMAMTPAGSLRPTPVDGFTPTEEATLVSACPGAVAEARVEAGFHSDPVWGAYRYMARAWAGHRDVRHEGATGGVLTALGMNALSTGRVNFVLHVGADPERPMRSRWVISESPESVQANTTSRYGPTAPLAGMSAALDRGQPFAIIAKPCDLGAVHALSRADPRDRRAVHRPPGPGVRRPVASVEVSGCAGRVRRRRGRGGAVPLPGARQSGTHRGGDP